MKQQVSGPYQVTQQNVERSSTLDGVDLGSWYVLLNGTMQFVESQQKGRDLVRLLKALD